MRLPKPPFSIILKIASSVSSHHKSRAPGVSTSFETGGNSHIEASTQLLIPAGLPWWGVAKVINLSRTSIPFLFCKKIPFSFPASSNVLIFVVKPTPYSSINDRATNPPILWAAIVIFPPD